jgi:hypothetical protein
MRLSALRSLLFAGRESKRIRAVDLWCAKPGRRKTRRGNGILFAPDAGAGRDGAEAGLAGSSFIRAIQRETPMPRRSKQLIDKRSTPEQEQARREQAFRSIRRLYRESLQPWTLCRSSACRRHRRCVAEARSIDEAQRCLTRTWPLLSEPAQQAAHAQVRQGGPFRRPPASVMERNLRRYPPTNFVLP